MGRKESNETKQKFLSFVHSECKELVQDNLFISLKKLPCMCHTSVEGAQW